MTAGENGSTRKPGNWIVLREVELQTPPADDGETITGGDLVKALTPIRDTPFVASSKKAAIREAAKYLNLGSGESASLLAIGEADYTPQKITVKVPDPVVAFA